MRLGRWIRSLGGRILLVTVGVAAVAVLVTAVASLQLVQNATTAQARAQLSLQVKALADRPLATLRVLADEETAASSGILFGLVGQDGAITGSAAGIVPPRIGRQVAAGRTVSTTVQRRGNSYVVEGKPRAAGGGVVAVRQVDEINRAGRLVIGQILLALAIGLLAAAIAGVLLARRITRPLLETAEAARRLAQGERGVTVASQNIPEVDDVAHALGTLDEALVTSEHRQREFLLSVSHEIRTPLTAIRGYAEALADGVVPPEDAPDVGATLVSEAERLDRFVADLLELARLEADDFAIDRHPVDLRELVQQTERAWQGRCLQLGVALSAELPGGTLVVTADALRLRQLIDGLVENALRATPPDGRVVVGVRADGHGFAIDVRDSGPGLTDDDATRAFQRGALRAKYRDVRPVGTGLGLSIAARLVERMGGSISAGSAPEGGARFTVELPGTQSE
ncbi:MAG TPA: HAMP domain-containing sensor histidine kinase [Diaminobutyricibacter sp.]